MHSKLTQKPLALTWGTILKLQKKSFQLGDDCF